jgi:hypothetical protein
MSFNRKRTKEESDVDLDDLDEHISKKRMIEEEEEDTEIDELDEPEEDTEIDELDEPEEDTEIDELDEPEEDTEIDEPDEPEEDTDIDYVYESEPENDLLVEEEYKTIQDRNPLFHPSILAITAHGNIRLNKKTKKYIVTKIPNGMELIKISISAPGVVNCNDRKNNNRQLVEIIKSTSKLLDENLNEHVLKNLVDRLRMYIQKNVVTQAIDRRTHLYKIYSKYYDEGFKIHILGPNATIANKTYYRQYGYDNKFKNEFILAKIDDGIDIQKIPDKNAYKIPTLPDLFDEFYPDKTYDDNFMQRTYLSEILQYYKNNGTTRLILFDFSCSVYETSTLSELAGEDLLKIREQNKTIPSGGKFNKKFSKKKNYKKKTYKRKSYKRKSYKIKSHKRKSYKRKSYKRKSYKK